MAEPVKQRALILQGGGALGAYEAGVFQRFYERYYEEGKPLFDIVAGVSIGAVNACLLVNYVRKSGGWKGSARMLSDFWNDVSTATWWLDHSANAWDFWNRLGESSAKYWKILFDKNPFLDWREKQPFLPLYFYWPDNIGSVASGEAARRYYSVWSFSRLGTPMVLSSAIPQPDFKFLDPMAPGFFRFDNAPLAEIIKKYWDYDGDPIRTGPEDGQPRLLLTSIDLQNSSTVTFDSYEKNGTRTTRYGDDSVQYSIRYDRGIGMEHLMTSMSSHLKYKYPTLDAKDGLGVKDTRHFWDGVYLSNTPLREVLQAHRDYWFKTKGKQDVPSLEILIVDLYPTVEKGVPSSADEIQDRQYDILFHDKTKYDEKIARVVSDYVDMSRDLIGLARTAGASEADIARVLNKLAKSTSRVGIRRRYRDLLSGRFKIAWVHRIERKEEGNDDISGKAFDFSSKSIKDLMDEGYAHACAQLPAPDEMSPKQS
jgi:predicted acylesterase/phospholipase RssA